MSLQPFGFRSRHGKALEAYILYKRALNRRYRAEAYALRLFDRYLSDHEPALLSAELIERFLDSRPRPRPRSYNHLRSVIGQWMRWAAARGHLERTLSLPPTRRPRDQRLPFLFDVATARRLIEATDALRDGPREHDRAFTYRVMFAVLYALGLRVGELGRLTWQDVDFTRNVLHIRATKFGKSRLVPTGPKLAELIAQLHERQRQARGSIAPEHPLFSFRHPTPITHTAISTTFHQLITRLALRPPPGVGTPRLHDLRHSFAVGTLTRWYRSGIHPAERLLYLSTFLGHVDPNSTAVYLTITEELLRHAAHRFARYAQTPTPGTPS